MSEVLIIGGGFAGVWAAAGVKRQARASGVGEAELRVTLLDGSDDMVIRPRLYERSPHDYRVPFDRVLGPIGVRRLAAVVTEIDTATKQVTAIDRAGRPRTLTYDRLVLAAGSRAVHPAFPGAEHLFDVDQMPAAAQLDSHFTLLKSRPSSEGRRTAVVIGAGFTGIEVACEVADRLRDVTGSAQKPRVVLVERADVVGPELGEGPRQEIHRALDALGIELRLGTTIDRISPTEVWLRDGTVIEADTAIWTGGMMASPLTQQIPGRRDTLGRLVVDEYLRVVGVPDVYAAGDTAAALAEPGQPVMQSCQHAVPQGKFVGQNVAADLLGLPQVPFAPDPYVTCLDLGSYGAVLTAGWDRTVQLTRMDAKELKRTINALWIYPPTDDPTLILDHADWRTTWPTAAISEQPAAV
jgi:NADH dehydrogenase